MAGGRAWSRAAGRPGRSRAPDIGGLAVWAPSAIPAKSSLSAVSALILGCQPSSVSARSLDISGAFRRQLHPAGVDRLQPRPPGQRRRRPQHRRGDRHRPTVEVPGHQLRGEHRVRGDVEGAARITQHRPGVRVGHVIGVHRLHPQPAVRRHQRDPAEAQQPHRQPAGRGSSGVISVPAARWKISPGRIRTTRSAGWSRSTPSSSASTSALCSAVRRAGHTGGRPPLTDRVVLRAGRVGADRRGVHQGRHTGPDHRVDHRPAAVDVGPAQHPLVVAGLDLPGQVHHRVRTGEDPRRAARPRPGAPMSQECHSTRSYGSPASGPGNRRATPASSTPRSRRSRRSSAVPTLPLAPTTTIRMPDPVPAQQQLNRPPSGRCARRARRPLDPLGFLKVAVSGARRTARLPETRVDQGRGESRTQPCFSLPRLPAVAARQRGQIQPTASASVSTSVPE